MRTMGDVHQSALAPMARLMQQEELRNKFRRAGYNPYVNMDDFKEESLNQKNHRVFNPWRVLYNLPQ